MVYVLGFMFLLAALLFLRPPEGRTLRFYVFTDLSTQPTTSGGSIFRCTTKDRGERRAKGVATPFNPPEFMRDIICRIGASRVRIGAPPVF